jgi:hypothetical protein
MLWWEMTDEQIADDPDALMSRQTAYASVLYESEVGRAVMLDIRSMCYTPGCLPEQRIALIELYNEIRRRAGGETKQAEMAMLSAELRTLSPIEDVGVAEKEDNLSIE